MTTFTAPPWIAMLQAHADQAEARTRALTETTTSLARDITNSAVDDILGPRPATHRAALNPDATTTLHTHGITPTQWISEHGTAGEWTGDRCGCPDSRCAGHHHDQGAECFCLAVLVREYQA